MKACVTAERKKLKNELDKAYSVVREIMMADALILDWEEVTRNCHVGKLDGVRVAVVDRSQKNRPDGSKRDWRFEVLGSKRDWRFEVLGSLIPWTEPSSFPWDPRDLESAKRAAEERLRRAVRYLTSRFPRTTKTLLAHTTERVIGLSPSVHHRKGNSKKAKEARPHSSSRKRWNAVDETLHKPDAGWKVRPKKK
jgi:hypothetical protein